MLLDAAQVVAFSLLTTLFTEGLSYVLVYRKESYQTAKHSAQQLNRRLDKERESLKQAIGNPKKVQRRIKDAEAQLRTLQRNSSQGQLLSAVLVALVHIYGAFALLNKWYGSIVVGRLPFVPFAMFRNLTHRGLAGADYTQCSATFFYVLSSLVWRSVVQRCTRFTIHFSLPSLFALPEDD